MAVEDGNEDGSAPVRRPSTSRYAGQRSAGATGDLTATVAEGGSYVLTGADSASPTRTTASGVTFTVSNQVNGSVKVNGDCGDELHRPAAGRWPGELRA